jgi:hypothetical protein
LHCQLLSRWSLASTQHWYFNLLKEFKRASVNQ